MKISLVVIGKTDASYLKEGIEEYCKRIAHYLPFELVVAPSLKNTKNLPVEVQKNKEAELLLAKIKQGSDIILLDEKGKNFSSREFASFVEKKSVSGAKELVFVVGGAFGFSDTLYKQGKGKISLSKMTFSHQLVRLLFLEQLYRAMTIIKGEPYHND